jgi:hypothetical protein
MCMENERQCISHPKKYTLLIFRRRRLNSTTTTTTTFFSTHTVSHIHIYTHHTYRVTDEGDTTTGIHLNITGHTHFPICRPFTTPPSSNTHTTHLILNHITYDDKCQHSYKDPWLPLPHIVTSLTLYTHTHTPLVRPPTLLLIHLA